MRRATMVAAAAVFVIAAGTVLLLRQYKLELIHLIVENAVIQKAPEGYLDDPIRQAFQANLERSRTAGREEAYLERLLQASQRLEKVQTLTADELDNMLVDLSLSTADH